MREVEFRGKCKETGKWVYGSYVYYGHYPHHCIVVNADIGGDGVTEPKYALESVEVDGDTLGQWTGCIDKDGTKIFEGDIVRADTYTMFEYEEPIESGEFCSTDCKTVKFEDGKFTNLHYRHDCEDSYYSTGTTSFKVISNIHDREKQ